jgi:hypothetical protein
LNKSEGIASLNLFYTKHLLSSFFFHGHSGNNWHFFPVDGRRPRNLSQQFTVVWLWCDQWENSNTVGFSSWLGRLLAKELMDDRDLYRASKGLIKGKLRKETENRNITRYKNDECKIRN